MFLGAGQFNGVIYIYPGFSVVAMATEFYPDLFWLSWQQHFRKHGL